MKLNLLFIVMELLTLLAYPIVFVHGKLRPFAKSRETAPVLIYSLLFQSHRANDQLAIPNTRKKGNDAY
jgi:hypothetical protein